MCMCVGTHLPQCACRGSKDDLGSQLFLSTVWVLEMELRLLGLSGRATSQPSAYPSTASPPLLPPPSPLLQAWAGRLRHRTESKPTEGDFLPSPHPIKVKDTESKKTNEP